MTTPSIVKNSDIGDYAFLSDCHSAALVGRDGSVDWLCLPRFDAPSVFARLLDDSAGHWRIAPASAYEVTRRYLDDTLVLETTFQTADGVVLVTDALVFDADERGHDIGMGAPHVLVRVVECTKGDVAVTAELAPRTEYGLVTPSIRYLDGGILARGGATILVLAGPAPSTIDGGTATWDLQLRNGQRVAFACQTAASWKPQPEPWSEEEIVHRVADTVAGWRSWSAMHQSYDGPWADLVHLSGRVLQGLTYRPTSAIVAAATTSLPEVIGGDRNWDYRYAWIRDASLTLNALWVAACPDEAGKFVRWMVDTVGAALVLEKGVQIMYGVGGEHDLSERRLGHLAGWQGSAPVRIGNEAWTQRQIDVLGELLDAVHRLDEQIGELDDHSCAFLAGLADEAARSWTDADAGIWEMRSEPRHYLYSQLMCWVALDRAVDLAPRLRAVDRVEAWRACATEIRSAILDKGWSEEREAYTQAFGSDAIDASALMLAITRFLPASDPRMRSTIDQVAAELVCPNGLLRRYEGEDGLEGEEGAFLLCSYWLAECLALADEVDQARTVFEQTTACANDLGLLAEEGDATTGALLGNYPQAFSHVGLVNAAYAIGQAEERAASTS